MNWLGVLDPSLLDEYFVATGHRLADAARDGDWATVVSIVDDSPPTDGAVNRWRPGGTSWFTPLHQAAWHGAPLSLVTELIGRGARAALAAHTEALYSDEAEKNELCAVIPSPDADIDWLRTTLVNTQSTIRWAKEPRIASWLEAARLNSVKTGLTGAPTPAQIGTLRTIVRHMTGAVDNLRRLRDEAA